MLQYTNKFEPSGLRHVPFKFNLFTIIWWKLKLCGRRGSACPARAEGMHIPARPACQDTHSQFLWQLWDRDQPRCFPHLLPPLVCTEETRPQAKSAAFAFQQNAEWCFSSLKGEGRRYWWLWYFGNFSFLPLMASLPLFVTLLTTHNSVPCPGRRSSSLPSCLLPWLCV